MRVYVLLMETDGHDIEVSVHLSIDLAKISAQEYEDMANQIKEMDKYILKWKGNPDLHWSYGKSTAMMRGERYTIFTRELVLDGQEASSQER